MLKAIVVDDEARARRVLKNLLDEYCPQIEIVADCQNVPDAVLKINQLEPDVVFCDIEMPDYSGFELLSFFKNVNFEIIFVTAFSDYAIRAFEVSAVDYLLKPVEIDKLEKSVERLEKRLEKDSMQERLEALKDNLKNKEISKIALPVSDGLIFVATNEIVHLEADGAYTSVRLKNGSKLLVSKKLKVFEDLLKDKSYFFRIHRSHIININSVKKYNRRDASIMLENDYSVSIARDRKQVFEEYISNIKI